MLPQNIYLFFLAFFVYYKVYVDKPYPVVKEVKVPHEVKVPAPYPVEKIEHYPVHIVSFPILTTHCLN